MLLSISIYRLDIVDISNLIASAASLSVFSISSCPIYGRATQLSAAFATSMSVRPSLSSWHSWVTHKRFIISMYALHHSSLQYYYSNSSHIIFTIKFRFFFSVLNSRDGQPRRRSDISGCVLVVQIDLFVFIWWREWGIPHVNVLQMWLVCDNRIQLNSRSIMHRNQPTLNCLLLCADWR